MVLAPAPRGVTGFPPEHAFLAKHVVSDVLIENSRHLVLSDQRGLHRVTVLSADDPGGRFVAVFPDGNLALRLAALQQFLGTKPQQSAARLQPSAAQRHRLSHCLKVLELLRQPGCANSSLRQIAEAVLFPHHDLGRAIEWKCSPQRRQAQRLMNTARYLVQNGYRDLLNGLTSPPTRATSSCEEWQ